MLKFTKDENVKFIENGSRLIPLLEEDGWTNVKEKKDGVQEEKPEKKAVKKSSVKKTARRKKAEDD